MKISEKDWLAYIDKLSRLNNTAAEKMKAYVRLHGLEDSQALIDYAYGIATKYGEGAAALSAEMYDEVAELSGKHLPPAEVAPTPKYPEVAKTVNGTKKNIEVMANAIGRLVKRTGVDTTMKNAIRDGAEWAWIPHGDTCAFCLTLASRGWQPASKAAMKGDHAEHIHAHCDCTYAIRFNGRPSYSGYNPDKYLKMYNDASDGSSQDKINALRRQKYQQNKDRINAQKRAAYAERKTLTKTVSLEDFEKLKVLPNNSHYRIDPEVINNIYETLDKLGGLRKFDSVTIESLGKGVVFDTKMAQNGTWYNCHLQINGDFFEGKALGQIEEKIRKSDNTVCQNLEECLKHEIAHARQTEKANAAIVRRINDEDGVEGISPLALEDMLESLAEASILRDRGQYDIIPKESRELLDKAAKELKLW